MGMNVDETIFFFFVNHRIVCQVEISKLNRCRRQLGLLSQPIQLLWHRNANELNISLVRKQRVALYAFAMRTVCAYHWICGGWWQKCRYNTRNTQRIVHQFYNTLAMSQFHTWAFLRAHLRNMNIIFEYFKVPSSLVWNDVCIVSRLNAKPFC